MHLNITLVAAQSFGSMNETALPLLGPTETENAKLSMTTCKQNITKVIGNLSRVGISLFQEGSLLHLGFYFEKKKSMKRWLHILNTPGEQMGLSSKGAACSILASLASSSLTFCVYIMCHWFVSREIFGIHKQRVLQRCVSGFQKKKNPLKDYRSTASNSR